MWGDPGEDIRGLGCDPWSCLPSRCGGLWAHPALGSAPPEVGLGVSISAGAFRGALRCDAPRKSGAGGRRFHPMGTSRGSRCPLPRPPALSPVWARGNPGPPWSRQSWWERQLSSQTGPPSPTCSGMQCSACAGEERNQPPPSPREWRF